MNSARAARGQLTPCRAAPSLRAWEAASCRQGPALTPPAPTLSLRQLLSTIQYSSSSCPISHGSWFRLHSVPSPYLILRHALMCLISHNAVLVKLRFPLNCIQVAPFKYSYPQYLHALINVLLLCMSIPTKYIREVQQGVLHVTARWLQVVLMLY